MTASWCHRITDTKEARQPCCTISRWPQLVVDAPGFYTTRWDVNLYAGRPNWDLLATVRPR